MMIFLRPLVAQLVHLVRQLPTYLSGWSSTLSWPPELLAYQAAIIWAERNYEGKQWVAYDRQYRREALARKDLNWSIPYIRHYNEAFTGRAKAIPRCSYCLQDDQPTSMCPKSHGIFPCGRPSQHLGLFLDPLMSGSTDRHM